MNRSFLCSVAVGLVLLGVGSTTRLHAQAFNQNSLSFTAGHGLDVLTGYVNNALESHGVTSQSLLGPYHFKIEKALTNNFGLSLNTSLMRNTYTMRPMNPGNEVVAQIGDEAERWAYSAVGRVNMHVLRGNKFDPYFGAGVGYRSATWTNAAEGPDFAGLDHTLAKSKIMFDYGVGLRYYLLPNLGVYAEYNAGQSPLQGGFIFNLPGNNSNGKHRGTVGKGNNGKGNGMTNNTGKGGGGSTSGGASGQSGKLKTHK